MGSLTRRRKRAAVLVAASLAVVACGLVPSLDEIDQETLIMIHPKTRDFPPRTKVDLADLGCFAVRLDGVTQRSTCDPPLQYPVLAYADQLNRVVVFRNDEPATLRFQRGGVRLLQHSGRDTVVQLDYATEPDDLYFSVSTATHIRACTVLLMSVVCGVDH